LEEEESGKYKKGKREEYPKIKICIKPLFLKEKEEEKDKKHWYKDNGYCSLSRET
jgi:hypothetical protein